jgi:WD40 repeat protein
MRDPYAPRVFISYSRRDGLDFARRLQTLLEAEGLSLYRDLNDLEGAEDWWRQVESAIRSVEHVVLVLTPGALSSTYVAREWKLARQEGRKVSPVTGPGALDFSHLPRWMSRANRHDIDIAESRARLVQVLKGPAGEKRVPFMADALPDGFVARPEEFDRLKRTLLDAPGEFVAITAALRGAGGYGKTALANALCHDSAIQDAFSDGILRVTLGERPDDLVGRIADLIETITGARPGFQSIDAAKVALADALDDRRCLLVIDDAWRVQDLAPFLHRGPRNQTTRLVTTRDDRVLPPGATHITVDAMKPGEALELLSHGIPVPIAAAVRSRLAALAARLGEWPLLLGLANGVVRARIARGARTMDGLDYAERAIAQRGISTAFLPDDRDSRRRTAWGALEISLEQLAADERIRFAELGVFVEDAEIPTAVAIGLWQRTAGLSPLDGEDLLARLAGLSLLWELDLGRGVLRLHDVVRTMLRENLIKGRLAELDRVVVQHFREASHGDLAGVTDVYGLRHLLAHLIGAGEAEAACTLLGEPRWLSNKLQGLGIQSLLYDYTRLWHCDAAVDLIGAALTLAAPALARDPRELAPQLLARLAPSDAVGLEGFLARIKSVLSRATLVPTRPTFTPPGPELRRFEGHQHWITCVTVVGDGQRALSASHDRTIRLWDLESGTELRRLEGHEDSVSHVTVLGDGRRVLSGSWDRTLRLWDLESGVELRQFDGHRSRVSSVTALGDGRRALSASADRTLRLWDLETGAELRRFEGHDREVSSVMVLGDGRRALSGSWDRTLRLWDLETGAELRRFEGHENWVTSMTVLGDGPRVLSGSWDRTLRLWDLETGAELRRFEGHEGRVTSVTVLGDRRRALSGSADWTLRLWDLETGAELRRFEGHEDRVTAVTVLGDGRRALSGSHDRTLRLWDLESCVELRRFEEHENSVTSLTVLGDGQRALSGSDDRTLRLWDLRTGAELRRFEGHEEDVSSVSVLGDGRHVLSGSWDRTLRLWDLVTGAELRRFEGHENLVTRVTLLGDGRRAFSRSTDRTLRLWDLETGAELARLTFDAAVTAFAWSSNQGYLVVGDFRGGVHVVEPVG